MPLAKGSDGYVVRLGDVAKVDWSSSERRAYYRSNGEPNVGLGIVKTSTANSLDVAAKRKAEAERSSRPCRTAPRSSSPSTPPPSSASVERVYATLVEPSCWCCW
jgi:multidrug efflux pump